MAGLRADSWPATSEGRLRRVESDSVIHDVRLDDIEERLRRAERQILELDLRTHPGLKRADRWFAILVALMIATGVVAVAGAFGLTWLAR